MCALMIDLGPHYFWNLNQFRHLDKQKVLCFNVLHLVADRYGLNTFFWWYIGLRCQIHLNRSTTIHKKFDPIIIKYKRYFSLGQSHLVWAIDLLALICKMSSIFQYLVFFSFFTKQADLTLDYLHQVAFRDRKSVV